MKKLLIILICVPLMGIGQGWEKIITEFPGKGYSVQQTVDGGYIVCSTHDSYSCLIKTDFNGDILWNKSYDFYDEKFFSVEETTDGGYIVCGYTNDVNQNSDYNLYLMKTDGSGDTLWTKVYPGTNGERGYSVQQTTDSGYIVCGTITDLSNPLFNRNDVYLIKIDANGLEQWSQTFGGIRHDYGESVQQTIDGGFIVVGTHQVFDSLSNINNEFTYLIKTNGNGIEQWNYLFADTMFYGNDYFFISNGESVQQTVDGGYIICGSSADLDMYAGYMYGDVFLVKTDANGLEQWRQTFGGITHDYGLSVQQTYDGGYIITGTTESYGSGDKDVYLIKTDGNGIEQWTKTFGGTNDDRGRDVQQTVDGGYIICGETRTLANGDPNVFLIKTDANGNATSTFNIPINSNRELKKVVDILGRDINPEKNKPFIEIYNDGTVEKKIIID
tara:strand:- start:65 stop:1396 length:1332 start_codon:yes stop_codon:yes gene_type:complete